MEGHYFVLLPRDFFRPELRIAQAKPHMTLNGCLSVCWLVGWLVFFVVVFLPFGQLRVRCTRVNILIPICEVNLSAVFAM